VIRLSKAQLRYLSVGLRPPPLDGLKRSTENVLRFDHQPGSISSVESTCLRLFSVTIQELERYRQRVAVKASFELRRHPEPLRLTWLAAFAYVRGRAITDSLGLPWHLAKRRLTLGHLKQLSREPRRIEILGQDKLAHFQSKVAQYRRLYDPFFSTVYLERAILHR
jgi:hypothetical protein